MIEYTNAIKEKTTIEPKTILEIGSRDGDDAELLRNDFNIESTNVWVVEPNPTQQTKIIEKYPNINLFKNPIFNVEKTITFYGVDVEDQILNGVSSLMNRIDGLYDKINTNKIEVETMSGSSLINLINTDIDVCKIDVEGATYEVLESFGDKLSHIKSMHIECEHRAVWVNQKLYQSVSEFLTNNGFSQIYFKYCNNDTLQSDSIWVQTKYLK
jgi:FkbM family methyltransferase